ncbi:hypothetical protein HMPREF1548_03941 [Clostridium sp. KLE 1755]|nr:hypothetical protein HMPREF1548_03941 [Clostridium sp. KLE 1755]
MAARIEPYLYIFTHKYPLFRNFSFPGITLWAYYKMASKEKL